MTSLSFKLLKLLFASMKKLSNTVVKVCFLQTITLLVHINGFKKLRLVLIVPVFAGGLEKNSTCTLGVCYLS